MLAVLYWTVDTGQWTLDSGHWTGQLGTVDGLSCTGQRRLGTVDGLSCTGQRRLGTVDTASGQWTGQSGQKYCPYSRILRVTLASF